MICHDVTIASVKGNDYRIHFWYMRKNDAISIMHNSNLSDKTGTLYFFFTIYKKWAKRLIIKKINQ